MRWKPGTLLRISYGSSIVGLVLVLEDKVNCYRLFEFTAGKETQRGLFPDLAQVELVQ